MRECLTVILTLLLFSFGISAQKTSIAIFPFKSADYSNRSRAVQLQQAVIEGLRKKPSIEILDRSNDSFFVKELDLQIREQSIAANGLVQQGKLLGAKQVIVGVLSGIDVTHESNKNIIGTGSTTTYTASINFALQLADVETGRVVSQKTFNSKEATASKVLGLFKSPITGSSKEESITNAIEGCKKLIIGWINESYPPEIKILKVEESDKKGYPETILVMGIEASEKGDQLNVNEIEYLDSGDGKKLRRSKKIAEVKIKEVEGDITVCKVTDGAKLLSEKMAAGAKMEFILK